MRTLSRPLTALFCTLPLALLVGGCERNAAAPAAALAAPVAGPAPAPAAPMPAAPVTAAEIALNCNDGVVVPGAGFSTENNAWGKGQLTGWSQCVGVGQNSAGSFAARWTWDWPEGSGDVKAYPEVVFGHKPGYAQSTHPALPRRLDALGRIQLSYEVQTTRYGAGNMAVDMWLTQSDKPDHFAVPPITHEIMVWLDQFGPMYAGGKQVDQTTLDGVPYRVYLGDKFGLGWRYVAFLPNIPLRASARMDLRVFFDYLRGKQLIAGSEYLAAINFGNEIISGKGETRLNLLSVDIQ